MSGLLRQKNSGRIKYVSYKRRASGGIGIPAYRQAGAHDLINIIMYYVYAIKSIARQYIYVGIASNVQKRILQHNSGRSRTTKPYTPFRTIFVEKVKDRRTAREREKYLKSRIGKEYLKTLL